MVASRWDDFLTGDRYVVAGTTVWSGASYIYTKDAVKILNAPKKKDGSKE